MRKKIAFILCAALLVFALNLPVSIAAAGEPDLAQTATVTTSSDYSADYSGAKAADSNDTTEWASFGEKNPWIKLTWATGQTMNKIVLQDRPNTNDNIFKAFINFSDGSSMTVYDIPKDGTAKEVFLETKSNITSVEVKLLGDGTTANNGLRGLGVYNADVLGEHIIKEWKGSDASSNNAGAVKADGTIFLPAADSSGHDIWGLNYNLKAGTYKIAIVLKVDGTTLSEDATEDTQLLRFNPVWNGEKFPFDVKVKDIALPDTFIVLETVVTSDTDGNCEVRFWNDRKIDITVSKVIIATENCEVKADNSALIAEVAAGTASSNNSGKVNDNGVLVLPKATAGGHDLWGVNVYAPAGKYKIAFVMQIDKGSIDRTKYENIDEAEIIRFNPNTAAGEQFPLDVVAGDFYRSNTWTVIETEFEVTTQMAQGNIELRFWNQGGADIKVKSVIFAEENYIVEGYDYDDYVNFIDENNLTTLFGTEATVEKGGTLSLPSKLSFVDLAGRTVEINVTWNTFDTNVEPGEYMATGILDQYYFNVLATVTVTESNGGDDGNNDDGNNDDGNNDDGSNDGGNNDDGNSDNGGNDSGNNGSDDKGEDNPETSDVSTMIYFALAGAAVFGGYKFKK